MTDEMMTLRALLEKSPDADVLREMGFYPVSTDTYEKADTGRKDRSCRSEGSSVRSSSRGLSSRSSSQG